MSRSRHPRPPRDPHHERNHHRQAGPMKDRRRELTEDELIEEQLEGCRLVCSCGATFHSLEQLEEHAAASGGLLHGDPS